MAEIGAALLREGIGAGASLALYMPNVPDFALAFFGGAKTGARLVALSPLDAERELAYKLKDSGARVLVTTDIGPILQMALKLLDAGHVDRLVVAENARWTDAPIPTLPIPKREGVIAWSDFIEDRTPIAHWPIVTPSDMALLQYTGGTTGLPEGRHADATPTSPRRSPCMSDGTRRRTSIA